MAVVLPDPFRDHEGLEELYGDPTVEPTPQGLDQRSNKVSIVYVVYS